MKKFEIHYTPAALNDMNKVWDDVFKVSRDETVSEKYVDDFIKAIETLRKIPKSGIPLLYRGMFTGFYSVNFKKYKAFYRVREDRMEVVRIIMSSRDYMKILFGDEQD